MAVRNVAGKSKVLTKGKGRKIPPPLELEVVKNETDF